MWVQTGNGHHTIDNTLLKITPNTFYLIAKGQVHHFIEGYDLVGYLVRFTDDFLLESATSTAWNYRVALFNHVSVHHTLPIGEAGDGEYELLFSLMMAEQERQEAYGKADLLRHLLSALLLKLERLRRLWAEALVAEDDGGQTAVLHAFFQLLEANYHQTHHVGDYAAELSITPRQLSRTLQQLLGKSAKQLIEDRLMLEAKRYLMHTNYSVKETAYRLGYKDPSYFSKVFKRATGVVPQDYRET